MKEISSSSSGGDDDVDDGKGPLSKEQYHYADGDMIRLAILLHDIAHVKIQNVETEKIVKNIVQSVFEQSIDTRQRDGILANAIAASNGFPLLF